MQLTNERILMRAALSNWDVARIKALLTGGYKIDQMVYDDTRETALHHVARYGTPELIALFVAHGAKVDVKDKYGDTPLMVSIEHDNDLWKDLLAAGASVTAVNKKNETALHRAAIREQFKPALCQALLEAGADLYATTKNGRTVLHVANSVQAFRFLREAGIDPHHQIASSAAGYLTPFQHWVVAGDAALVKACLDEGSVDLHQTTRAGRTLMQLATDSSVIAILNAVTTQKTVEKVFAGLTGEEGAPVARRPAGLSL